MFKFLSSYKGSSLIVAFIAVNNIIAVTFNLGFPYYLVMFGMFIFVMANSHVENVNKLFTFFIAACISSIIVNDIPSFFNPWGRLASFILVTSLIAPFFGSQSLYRLRMEVFELIQYFLQPIVILSFLTYLAGMSFTVRARFSGITVHSMILAPICADVILFSVYKLMRHKISHKSRINIKWRIYYIGLIVISFLTLLLCASRTALIGIIIATLVLLYFANGRKILKTISMVIAVALVWGMSESYLISYTAGLEYKNESSMRGGSMMSTRESHWHQRINEFLSSPVFGVGFGNIDIEVDEGSNFNEDKGQIETGSSWLSILSMTGILGLICFLALFIRSIKQLTDIYRRNPRICLLLTGLLTFWCIHMMAEGYILAAGGFLFFNVWLLLGVIDATYHIKNLDFSF